MPVDCRSEAVLNGELCLRSNSVSGRANKKVEEEERKLLKLFQGVNHSQDGFTQWCEQTLHVLNTANNLDGEPCPRISSAGPAPSSARCPRGSPHHTRVHARAQPVACLNLCLCKGVRLIRPPPSPLSPWPAVPTFASFLKEVESPYEIHDYVRAYLGDTPEAKDFAKHFLERRAKQKANQQQPPQQQQQQQKPQKQSQQVSVPRARGPACSQFRNRWDAHTHNFRKMG